MVGSCVEPLPKYATERDFCTLFIHNRKGTCKTDKGLLAFLEPYLPQNQYKIRSWLKPDGLLLLFKTEEMARRVKDDLDMRDPEFVVDYWAIRPVEKEASADEAGEKDAETEEPTEPVAVKKEEEKIKETNSFAALAEEH